MQNYLLVELQKSEGGESCWGQSNIGNQETGAASVSSHTSNKETCADTHSIPPSQASSSRKEPFLRPRGSGRLFFPILRTEELSVNTGLLNGFKNGASLRSRWTTIWRFTSLGHEKASTAESVRKTWSTRFLRKALVSTYPWRKQQDKIRVLWGFQKILGLLSSNSRTLWWNAKWPWVNGVFSNSLDLERVFFTEVAFSAFNLSFRMDWFQVDVKATKDGRLSCSHHLTLLVEIPTKKNFVMITQFFKNCTTTVIGNVIKMPCIV